MAKQSLLLLSNIHTADCHHELKDRGKCTGLLGSLSSEAGGLVAVIERVC
jgi:hypothetical protein